MIYHHIPWSTNKCIGTAYNQILHKHKDEDWVTVIDADAMHTTNDWYQELEQAIQKFPKAKGFGSRTNRVRSLNQLLSGIDLDNHDISYHRKLGAYMMKSFKGQVTPHFDTKYAGHFSGLWFAFHVGTIKQLGGFYESGSQQLTDNYFHANIINNGYEFYILDSVYVYHWYRADNEYSQFQPVKKTLMDMQFNGVRLIAEDKK
jgi:hypothetical protein